MSDRYEVWRKNPDGRGGTFESLWHWHFVIDADEVIARSPQGYKTRAMALRRIMRLIGHGHMPVHFTKFGQEPYIVMSHLITKGGRVRTCEELMS